MSSKRVKREVVNADPPNSSHSSSAPGETDRLRKEVNHKNEVFCFEMKVNSSRLLTRWKILYIKSRKGCAVRFVPNYFISPSILHVVMSSVIPYGLVQNSFDG